MRLLVLGGTGEARTLAADLAARPDIVTTISLAGVTRAPAALAVPTRIGGFGGPAGLARYLADACIDRLIDASHPFAGTISAHAAAACRATATPYWRLERPAWSARPAEHWITVPDAQAAARALATLGRRVFLTVGARSLAPFVPVADKHWLVRSIEAPDPPPAFADWQLLRARPPFSLADEIALLRRHAIDVLVTKNSGAPAMRTKLDAARTLGVPVVMIARPAPPPADGHFAAVDALLAALDAHQKSAG